MLEKTYGRNSVYEILAANPQVVKKLYIAAGGKGHKLLEILKLAKSHNIPVEFESRHTLSSLVGIQDHQGVIADVEFVQPNYAPSDLVKIAEKNKELPLIIILDRIQDPQNVGAIIRTSYAAGAHGMILPKDHSPDITPTVMKASAGTAMHLPICYVTNLVQAIQELKTAGVWVTGADASSTVNYTTADWNRSIALVIGNEGEGIRRLVKENCDTLVSIPIKGKLSSLNASVSAGILLFEIVSHPRPSPLIKTQ